MPSLYPESSIIHRLFTFFSSFFPYGTRPTKQLLTWLLVAQITLQSCSSLRFLHRHFLTKIFPRCLNSYYRAIRGRAVDIQFLHQQTMKMACQLIPSSLKNEPIFLSVDDTTVPKFGRFFDDVSILHDHARHTGKCFVNGHCFVSLTASIPVLVHLTGKAPCIRYIAISIGHVLWTKQQSKLELAGNLIEEVMPFLKGRQVLLCFDSWYAKTDLIERVLRYPNLQIICNVRSDSVMYELPPLPTGRPGRPRKHGPRIRLEDFVLSHQMGGLQMGYRQVLTNIFGSRRVYAYVTCTQAGSRRVFFSTLNPENLHMSFAWQERKDWRSASTADRKYYPLKLYKVRWGIETNYYEQKMFWSLGGYRIRRRSGIEHWVNLVNLVHSSLKILPYREPDLADFQNTSPQELRSWLSWQIQQEIFFKGLADKVQTTKNGRELLTVLRTLAFQIQLVA